MCQVAAVVMETKLSQLKKKLFIVVNGELNKVSLLCAKNNQTL